MIPQYLIILPACIHARQEKLEKMKARIRKTLASTKFADAPMVHRHMHAHAHAHAEHVHVEHVPAVVMHMQMCIHTTRRWWTCRPDPAVVSYPHPHPHPHSSHFTLHTPHFTLHTSHFTLHASRSPSPSPSPSLLTPHPHPILTLTPLPLTSYLSPSTSTSHFTLTLSPRWAWRQDQAVVS